MALPRLLPVLCTLDLPNIKLTRSGITILHQRGSQGRYGGSARHRVDMSGKLWENKNDMIKSLYPERISKGKKKAPVAPDANNLNTFQSEYIDFLEELPTHEREFCTKTEELFTNYGVEIVEKPVRTYVVKKTEVRQRILCRISAKTQSFAELYFWTVTFPAGSSDDIIYQIFNNWLTALRKKDQYGRILLKDYLWIAERQDGKRLKDPTKATNTIHFHIAIPHFMRVHHANKVMQTILASHARKGTIPFTRQQCNKYNGIHLAKDKGGKVINFASKKGSRAITGYLTKYLTKNNERFTHLAWHNSRGFSNMFTAFYTTRRHFYSMGVRRKTILGTWQVVSWAECLETDKNKWFPKRGDQEDKEESERRRVEGTDYFQFIPWNNQGMPENIAAHMDELNGYCIDNFGKQKSTNNERQITLGKG